MSLERYLQHFRPRLRAVFSAVAAAAGFSIAVLCGITGCGGPVDSDDVLTRIAFGSCALEDRDQPLWDAVDSADPQLWIWLGDIVYADTEDMTVMREKYAMQRNVPGYKRLVRKCRVVGVWDDHDYGADNGGAGYPKKREAQQILLDFLEEPEESPRRMRAGVYTSYDFGPPGRQVRVTLLDTRFHREQPGPTADILGEEQWEWLFDQLHHSEADLNILVSSIQVVAMDNTAEKWANFPLSRDRLFELIASSGARNVIVLSGDRHFAEISRVETNGSILLDVTSSGINTAVSNFAGELNRYRVGSVYTHPNFGFIEIDWEEGRVKVQIRDRENRTRLHEVMTLATH